MWGLQSPRIFFDWNNPRSSHHRKEENDTMDYIMETHYCNPLRITPNVSKTSRKMHSHISCNKYSTGRPESFLRRKVRTRSTSSSTKSLYIVVILVCLAFENSIFTKSSAEPVVPRIVRSSVIRPTRVTYGDIEKTNKTCAPKDTCAPSRNGMIIILIAFPD